MSLSEQLIEHGEPLLAVDATFAVMRVNRAWETLTGIARSEAVGRSLWSLYETESPEGARWRRGIERCLALRVTGVFERAKGPNIGWTSARVQPLENGLALYFKDISTERRSELEREELAAQRQLALDAAKMGWWTYDPVKQHATADARFAEIFGLETPAIDMPTWQSLVHPDDFPAALKALTSSVEHPDHPDYITQYRIRPPGGVEKWVEAHGIAVFTPGASPSAQLVVGTARDITERKRSEQALAAALEAEETERRRLQAVLQALPAGVLITDAEGRPLQANDAFRRIWGAPPMTGNRHDYGEWKGYRAATGQPLKTEEWAMARALATGKPAVAEEIEIERFDGSGRATIINAAAPILDAAGKIIGGVVAEIDVTAQVRAEELARAAMERTARAEDQLRHAQKLEAVGQLAGGVAHDFNNLLTVIIASSEYLAEELPAGSPLREEVDEVKKASDRAAALVRQLLAFSRKQVLEPRVVDVNELLRGLERLLARLLSERHALAIRPASDALLCTLDAGQFEQVLVNLVVNSRDAMPTGGNIVIEADQLTLGAADVVETPGLQPGPHVRLVVTDDGSGIPLEVQARVFEPFFTTKGPDRGTGLGLATVYGIVKQSGGAISFTSEPGRGRRFTLLFPRAMAGSTQPAPSAPGPAARAEANETVLLVEDDTQVRQAVEGMLRRAGYRVLNAANGDAAVKVSEGYAGTIDVLLTDVIMPGVSGRKLAEKLRAQRPGLRVLFMSGYSDDELARGGTLDPDVQFIRKPLTNEALLARLRKVLRPASSPREQRGETPAS